MNYRSYLPTYLLFEWPCYGLSNNQSNLIIRDSADDLGLLFCLKRAEKDRATFAAFQLAIFRPKNKP